MKRCIPFLLLFCLMLAGCEGGQQSSVPTEIVVSDTSSETAEQLPSVFPITVCGTEIKEEAKRVISLSPAVTEIIAELGYVDRLCGISSYCDYPRDLDIQAVGSAENPEMDMITGLKADVLFTLSGLSERDIYALEEAGTAVVCLETPSTLEGYTKLYSDIASVFAGEKVGTEKGSAAVQALKAGISTAFSGSYIYVTPKLTVAGADTFENAVLSLAGENLCTEEGYCETLSLEGVQPEYIIASDIFTTADLSADDVLSSMIDGGAEVIFVDTMGFERPSARTADIFKQNISETTETSE